MPKAPDQERRNNSETVEARSRTRRPGRMQEQPEHSIAANDEPPVLASMELAACKGGETVYVELSPESGVCAKKSRCLRCLLLVMCTHPFAKKALTLHLAHPFAKKALTPPFSAKRRSRTLFRL